MPCNFAFKQKDQTPLKNNIQLMSRHGKCSNPTWWLRVANGVHRVVVGYADPGETALAERCSLNGAPATDGSTVSGQDFVFQSMQEVTNGLLEFSGKFSDRCSSIAYIVVDDASFYFA